MKARKRNFFIAISLIAASYCAQAFAQESYLPFDKVVEVLRTMESRTTLQNNKVERELVGKVFEGDVQVSDVVGGAPELVEIYVDFPKDFAEFEFLVSDPHLKDVGANLSPKSMLRMTGTLKSISYMHRYSNVRNSYRATFDNVSFEIK